MDTIQNHYSIITLRELPARHYENKKSDPAKIATTFEEVGATPTELKTIAVYQTLAGLKSLRRVSLLKISYRAKKVTDWLT